MKSGAVDVHHDVEVPRRAAPLARLAFARQLEAGAGIDAGRDLDREHALGVDLSGSPGR